MATTDQPHIDAIEDMMATLNWSTGRAKALAELWGIPYNPEMKRLAVAAQQQLLNRMKAKVKSKWPSPKT